MMFVVMQRGLPRSTRCYTLFPDTTLFRSVHHARPIMVDGKVVGVLLLSRSARALFKGLYEDRGKIAIGIAAILTVLIVLSGVLSRGIARPIEALGAATRSVAAGRGREIGRAHV